MTWKSLHKDPYFPCIKNMFWVLHRGFSLPPRENNDDCNQNFLIYSYIAWFLTVYRLYAHPHTFPIKTRKPPKTLKNKQGLCETFAADYLLLDSHHCELMSVLRASGFLPRKVGWVGWRESFTLVLGCICVVLFFFSFCLLCHFYVVDYTCKRNQ